MLINSVANSNFFIVIFLYLLFADANVFITLMIDFVNLLGRTDYSDYTDLASLVFNPIPYFF